MCDQQSLRSACAYAQSDQSLCLLLEYSMTVKLLSKHHLEIISLKGGCTGSSESTLFKIPNCWKSHVAAQMKVYGKLHYLFVCWIIVHAFIASASFFSKLTSFGSTRRVSNDLYPDQDRRSVYPDLVPSCLQSLSTDYEIHR